MEYQHIPVLLNEAVEYLNLKDGDIVVDGTLGGGGHSEQLLKRISPTGYLYAFDLDTDAIAHCQEKFQKYKNFKLINDNFKSLEEYGQQLGILSKIRGILLDLGISNHEIRSAGRGFSFQKPDEPLDLRMDPNGSLTAADVLNKYREDRIKNILRNYGEEPQATTIARRAAEFRKTKRFETVSDLLQIIEEVYQGKRRPKRIHVATKTWQALRIVVNEELDSLAQALPIAVEALAPGGRLAVIAFHSLEDRIVKQYFRHEAKDCICPPEIPVCRCNHPVKIKILTKKPIVPSVDERQINPQCRSAKLRVIEKI